MFRKFNNNWEADHVAVNATGTASLNVQVTDASNNPLASQNVYQAQPASVAALSYASMEYLSGTDFSVNSARWPFAADALSEWVLGQGGQWQDWGWGEDFDGDENFGPYSYDEGSSTAGAGAWENVLGSYAIENSGEQATMQEAIQTKVMIQPAGQQSIGQTALYLVLAQVTNEDSGLQLAASAVSFLHQLSGTTTQDVTNSDGSVWTEAVVSAPAGNVSVTNINVFPSLVALTIDCPSTNELWNQILTVTGTIADSGDYTVWVNGAKATSSGTSWTATNVYLPQGGTAVIQARAIANSDNGGNGTGGGGGGPVTYDSLGNPDPPQDNDVENDSDKPPQVYVQSYNLNYSSQITGYTTNIAGIRYTKVNETIAMNWANNKGGTEKYDYFEVLDSRFPTSWISDDQTTVWPVDGSPPTLGGTQTSMETSGFGGGGTSVTNVGSPSLGWESCVIQGTANYNYAGEATYPDAYSRKAQTMVRYFTGGKSAPLRENLHRLGVSVHQQTFEAGFEGGSESSGAAITNGVTAGVFGAVGTDGNSWKALADGQDVDITPTAGIVNNYNFGESVTKYTLAVTANGTALDPEIVTVGAYFCVGQRVTFGVSGLPSLTDAIAYWKLPGTFVNTNSPVCDAYYYENANLLINDLVVNGTLSTSCWYVKDLQPGTANVDLQLYFPNGQNVHIAPSGQFNMYRPQIIDYHPLYHGTPQIAATNGLLTLMQNPHDMSFEHSIQSDFPGVAGYTQLVSGEWQTDPEGIPLVGTELDTGEFPRGQIPIDPASTVSFWDAPHVSLSDNSTETTEDLEFNTYLMFKPSGGIFVPLRLVNWEVHDSATPNSGGGWDVSGSATITSQGDTTAFPYWTNTFTGGL